MAIQKDDLYLHVLMTNPGVNNKTPAIMKPQNPIIYHSVKGFKKTGTVINKEVQVVARLIKKKTKQTKYKTN